MKKTIFACIAILSSSVAIAGGEDQIVLSSAMSKSGAAMSIDVVSSGKASAFNFAIPLPANVKVDVSNCLNKLPASYKGRCEVKDGEVRVIAFSSKNESMKAGVHQIGSLRLYGLKDVSSLQVTRVEIVDGAGEKISNDARIQ